MFWNAQACQDLAVLNLAFVGGKNCNPCSVTVNWPYRSNYILPTTWRHIYSWILGSNAPNSLLASSTLHFQCSFWGWKINTSLSKCTVVWVYSNTGMIESVKIIPGANIASLGLKRSMLKSHLSLMFQNVVSWLFFPHGRCRCLFLLSKEIKTDYSVQIAVWALSTYSCYESIHRKKLRSRQMLGQKKLHLRHF